MKFLFNSINHPIYYTTGSFLMAVVASNILIVIIAVCLYSKRIIRNTGYRILLFFLAATFVRFVFPIDLPFSVTVTMPQSLSSGLKVIYSPVISIKNFRISLWQIAAAIWLVTALILLKRNIHQLRGSKRFVNAWGQDISDKEPYASCMAKICQERGKKNKFRIVRIYGVDVPKIYGILRPYILIPLKFEMDEKGLYYVLCHETSHYFRHDLFMRLCTSALMCIYWWNPFVYLFKKQTDLLLEIQVDDKVIGKDKEKGMEYLNCLFQVKYTVEREKLKKKTGRKNLLNRKLLSFFKKNDKELERRFLRILEADKRKKKWVNIVLTTIIVVIYYLSYQFVFEGFYRPYGIDEDKAEKSAVFYPHPNELYAVENEDGTYSIYCNYPTYQNPLFLERVEDIKNFVLIENIYYLEKGKYKEP